MYDGSWSLPLPEKAVATFSLMSCRKQQGWARAMNSLLEGADVDIYVTGSNSKLMSSRDFDLSYRAVCDYSRLYIVVQRISCI